MFQQQQIHKKKQNKKICNKLIQQDISLWSVNQPQTFDYLDNSFSDQSLKSSSNQLFGQSSIEQYSFFQDMNNMSTISNEQQFEETKINNNNIEEIDKNSQQIIMEYKKDDEKDELQNSDQNDEQTIIEFKNPQQDRVQFKKVSYNTLLKQQCYEPQKLLSGPRKFYLFLDQMIDLEYFQKINQQNQFAINNQEVQLHKGFKVTHSVIHRVDNKCIEISSEMINPQPQSIDYIIDYLKSQGNQDLIKYINCLIEFQRSIQICKQLIKAQSLDKQFLSCKRERKAAADAKFRQITSQFDQNELIYYTRFSVDYEKHQFQSTLIGYTPALYEVLDNGSYSFKDRLLKHGYFDPLSQLFRLGDCFYRTCYFMSQLPKEFDQNLEKEAEFDLITCDNFRFPIKMKLIHYHLEQEYDKDNGFDFKFQDILGAYKIEFNDPSVFQNLQQIRKETIFNQSQLEKIDDNIDWSQLDFTQTQFFNQYYSSDIQDLVIKGNKWFKRCGFTDIPSKKQKQ